MNSVNAVWMSEQLPAVRPAAAGTNSVQAYCRLAIMIMATSDATS